MNVVNYSEGARLAGVSRQMITKLKNAHKEGKSKKSYFVFDPDTGNPGINIDDKSWIRYVDKDCKHRSHKNEFVNTTKVQPIERESSDYVNKTNLITSMVGCLKETKKFTPAELRGLTQKISRRYEELENGK